MNIVQTLRTALTALNANKMRSSLTILGVVIGVTAVISLIAIGRGSQAAVVSNIQALGTNLIFVTPGASNQGGGVRGAAGSAVTLTLDDANALVDPTLSPAVLAVAPQVQAFAQVVAGRQNMNAQVLGVTAAYAEVRNTPVASGQFITAGQVTSRSLVAVIGSNVAQTLFAGQDPIGQTIKVGSAPLKVIGVLQSKGGTSFGSIDNQVLAPITTVQYNISSSRTAAGRQNVQTINIQATSSKTVTAAIQQITSILDQRHKIVPPATSDFTITSQQDTIAASEQSTQVWVVFLGVIAGISLLVGGIGIMNIMLVSVTERTREIGIRKAIGAKRRDILLQFLIEAASLSLTGGALGVLLGWGVSHFVSGMTLGGQTIHTTMSADIIIMAVGVSVAIGIFFGLYPAYRAARLNPIDALRYE